MKSAVLKRTMNYNGKLWIFLYKDESISAAFDNIWQSAYQNQIAITPNSYDYLCETDFPCVFKSSSDRDYSFDRGYRRMYIVLYLNGSISEIKFKVLYNTFKFPSKTVLAILYPWFEISEHNFIYKNSHERF